MVHVADLKLDSVHDVDEVVREYDGVLVVKADGNAYIAGDFDSFLSGDRIRIDDGGAIVTHVSKILPPIGGGDIAYVDKITVVGAIKKVDSGLVMSTLKTCRISSEFGNISIDFGRLPGEASSGLELLEQFEIDSDGKRVFLIKMSNGDCGDLGTEAGRACFLDEGRAVATALQDLVGSSQCAGDGLIRSNALRFEVEADTPAAQKEVEALLQRLRLEFARIGFEASFGGSQIRRQTRKGRGPY